MREAVLTYKKVVEVSDNLTYSATGNDPTFSVSEIHPDDISDILLGCNVFVHSDSDPIGGDLHIGVSEQTGPVGEQYVTWSPSNTGSPASFFVHATLTAVFAVSK